MLRRTALGFVGLCCSVFAVVAVSPLAAAAEDNAETKKIVFVAGPKSHGYGAHEHYAGCMVLAECLKEAVPSVETSVYKNGWPDDPHAFDGAAAIVLFADGGGRNPINKHLEQVGKLMEQGVGLSCLHYAVEVPKGKPGECLKDWIGGYFEVHWSVNPHWKAEFAEFPDHPIANGVSPFSIHDEWYYHMRFRDDMEGVVPILSAVPPESTRQRPDGAHSNNPAVRARSGMAEHLGWARERDDGGRGFGFTGGHWQWNWAHDDFRKVVLNGIAWTAKVEIPEQGLVTETPSFKELEAHQDYEQPERFSKEKWVKKIQQWNES